MPPWYRVGCGKLEALVFNDILSPKFSAKGGELLSDWTRVEDLHAEWGHGINYNGSFCTTLCKLETPFENSIRPYVVLRSVCIHECVLYQRSAGAFLPLT